MKRAASPSARTRGTLRLIAAGGASSCAGLGDAELLLAFEHRDPAASVELYDRLIRVVDSTLVRMLGGRGSDHDDLVQTVFERVVSTLRRRTFSGACRLTTWAGAIATNVALSAIRTRQRSRLSVSLAEGETEPVDRHPSRQVHDVIESRRQLERVRSHLAQMDEARARAVVLYDVLGHGLAEMAEIEGVTVAAVQSRLVRGRKELHKRLSEEQR